MSSNNTDQLRVLETLLTDVLELKEAGGPHARLAHAQGYADGYMRLLMDSKVATQRELLALVATVRSRFYGPSVAEVVLPSSAETLVRGDATIGRAA
ncbi:MAG: hypothetical protein SFV15_16975 [Polyangiaceae bacterium]|nr:hypothetical protein [Polyangiaceae bacterium]